MTSMQLVGLNTKYYRYQHGLTQEEYAAQSFNITPKDLFDEETAKLAKKLPPRIDMYHK